MKPLSEQIKLKPWIGWAIFFATIVIVFFVEVLASSIIERRAEAYFAYTPRVKYSQFEPGFLA
jgi:nitrite reductase (cytochrome c-552)